MFTKSVEAIDDSAIGKNIVLTNFMFTGMGRYDGDYYVDGTLYEDDSPAPLRATFRANEKILRSILKSVPGRFKRLIEETVFEKRNPLVVDPLITRVEIPAVAGKVFWSDALQRPCVDAELNLMDSDMMEEYAARRTG